MLALHGRYKTYYWGGFLEVSVDYLIGKTSLVIDKEAMRRLEDISKLPEDNKSFILNLIDMALRDMKAKNAYAWTGRNKV